MRRLFPPETIPRNYEPDEVYSVPELAFPLDGVALPNGGRRPYIYFNMVSSADGKTVTVAKNATGLGSPTDFHFMGRLRMGADAVLIGAETFRRDSFVPDIRPGLLGERTRYYPDAPHPLGITISRDGNLPLDKKFFAAPASRRVVFLYKDASAERETALAERARVFRLGSDSEGHPDLGQMLALLYEQLGVRHLLCEGGPTLNYAMLSKNFGDEIFWTLAPKIVGGSENPTLVSGSGLGFPIEKILKLGLISIYEKNSELFMRYRLEYQAA